MSTNNRRYPRQEGLDMRLLNEDEEDQRLNALHSKVASLKAITIEIGNEVKEQNKFLDGMGLDFSTATERMSGTLRTLKQLAQTEQGRYYLFWTILFFLLILLLLYWIF